MVVVFIRFVSLPICSIHSAHSLGAMSAQVKCPSCYGGGEDFPCKVYVQLNRRSLARVELTTEELACIAANLREAVLRQQSRSSHSATQLSEDHLARINENRIQALHRQQLRSSSSLEARLLINAPSESVAKLTHARSASVKQPMCGSPLNSRSTPKSVTNWRIMNIRYRISSTHCTTNCNIC